MTSRCVESGEFVHGERDWKTGDEMRNPQISENPRAPDSRKALPALALVDSEISYI